MQFSKPKMSIDFVKSFSEKVYKTKIDLTEINIKTFIIEEERDDVKVIFEGFKDLVSNVEFDIVDGTLNIKVLSREKSGISSNVKMHSVFTMENKLSIYLPTHFNNYNIIGDDASIRVNNLLTNILDTTINNGSIKVKYCTVNERLSVSSDNALISIKSIDSSGVLNVKNDNGITKLRDIDVVGDINVDTSNGMLSAKTIKASEMFNCKTLNGSIDLDDVYASVVNVDADNGIVNYFNGNFSKHFEVNLNVKNGVVRTNVLREEIH